MDVKYFKPVKRTEENSTEEWLILCLISQMGALPREFAWVFEGPGEWAVLGRSLEGQAPTR